MLQFNLWSTVVVIYYNILNLFRWLKENIKLQPQSFPNRGGSHMVYNAIAIHRNVCIVLMLASRN